MVFFCFVFLNTDRWRGFGNQCRINSSEAGIDLFLSLTLFRPPRRINSTFSVWSVGGGGKGRCTIHNTSASTQIRSQERKQRGTFKWHQRPYHVGITIQKEVGGGERAGGRKVERGRHEEPKAGRSREYHSRSDKTAKRKNLPPPLQPKYLNAIPPFRNYIS